MNIHAMNIQLTVVVGVNWTLHLCMQYARRPLLMTTGKSTTTGVEFNPSRHNQQCEKNDVVLGRAHRAPQRRTMDLTCHVTWRPCDKKNDKEDQPEHAETTWKNRGLLEGHDLAVQIQSKTGYNLEAAYCMRPSSNQRPSK